MKISEPHIGRHPGGSAKVTAFVCPVCRKRLDAATDASGESGLPSPGDYTVCIGCATVLRFNFAVVPMRLPAKKLATLPVEDRRDIARAVAAVKEMNADRKNATEREV